MEIGPGAKLSQVRSLTFNIKGIGGAGLEEIIKAIVEKNPDVVLFHDVDTNKERSGLLQIDFIRRRVEEETRNARGSCQSSDVVFGAELRTSASAIMTRNGFTIAAGEEVESIPLRAVGHGRLRLSEVAPVLVAMVKAPTGELFSIVSTSLLPDAVTEPSALNALTRMARAQARTVQQPSAILLDDTTKDTPVLAPLPLA